MTLKSPSKCGFEFFHGSYDPLLVGMLITIHDMKYYTSVLQICDEIVELESKAPRRSTSDMLTERSPKDFSQTQTAGR